MTTEFTAEQIQRWLHDLDHAEQQIVAYMGKAIALECLVRDRARAQERAGAPAHAKPLDEDLPGWDGAPEPASDADTFGRFAQPGAKEAVLRDPIARAVMAHPHPLPYTAKHATLPWFTDVHEVPRLCGELVSLGVRLKLQGLHRVSVFARSGNDSIERQCELADTVRAVIKEARIHLQMQHDSVGHARLPKVPPDAPEGQLKLVRSTESIYLDGQIIQVKDRPRNAYLFLNKLCQTPNELVAYSDLNGLLLDWYSKTTSDARQALKRAFEAAGKVEFFKAAVRNMRGRGYWIALQQAPIIE